MLEKGAIHFVSLHLLQCCKDSVIHFNVIFGFKFRRLQIPIDPLVKGVAVLAIISM